MPEPISILVSVRTLSSVAFQLGKTLASVQQKYQQAPRILALLSTECTVAATAMAKIQQIMENKAAILKSGFDGETNVTACFELALTTWATTFSILDTELSKFDGNHGVLSRIRFIWSESTLDELRRQLRDLSSSVNFLLQSFQT